MKLYYHRYQLYPKTVLNAHSRGEAREGLLLRNERGGIACLHPWEELGDCSLSVQVEALIVGNPTVLGHQALICMESDALAREAGVPLLSHPEMIPCSHATLPMGADTDDLALLVDCGFSAMKWKVNGRVERNLHKALLKLKQWSVLFPSISWRIDFNGTLPPDRVLSFWKECQQLVGNRLDFWEDPSAWDKNLYQKWSEDGVILAPDRDGETFVQEKEWIGVNHWVVKPALLSVEEVMQMPWVCDFSHRRTIIVTSYMDHPIGQVWAAYSAMRMQQCLKVNSGVNMGKAGLLTHPLYEKNVFSERWGKLSPEFPVPREGETGLGFDDLIEKLEWKRLSYF